MMTVEVTGRDRRTTADALLMFHHRRHALKLPWAGKFIKIHLKFNTEDFHPTEAQTTNASAERPTSKSASTISQQNAKIRIQSAIPTRAAATISSHVTWTCRVTRAQATRWLQAAESTRAASWARTDIRTVQLLITEARRVAATIATHATVRLSRDTWIRRLKVASMIARLSPVPVLGIPALHIKLSGSVTTLATKSGRQNSLKATQAHGAATSKTTATTDSAAATENPSFRHRSSSTLRCALINWTADAQAFQVDLHLVLVATTAQGSK